MKKGAGGRWEVGHAASAIGPAAVGEVAPGTGDWDMAEDSGNTAEVTVTVDGLAKIDLAGDLDLLTAECAGIRLRAAIAAGPARTCLDLGQVQFIDAHGLAVLLDTAAFARGNGVHLKVVNINAQPRKIIDVTGTGNALGIT
ncbi:hypothetical protein GCM10009679_17890 [Saccharothrix algeriensis]|uniref:STAS domain-containing protein n=1 Tax=Catellatospora bangladeshensis TaxID=310355 RepID=A0A8J3JS46_9ACTN|nr:hypothetical protein Cba03nite_73750 [Catellatospora bangladeshensis]